MSEMKDIQLKPAINHSYETLALTNSVLNSKIRPCGFRKNGKMRRIKNTCLLAKIKTRCRIRNRNPSIAVCITMYNESEEDLKYTITGVLHNYNELKNDKDLEFKKQDFLIFLICDGFERISDSFKKYATDKGFFDQELLQEKGYLEQNRDNQWKMKDMRDVVEKGVENIPSNIIHMFQVSTQDFGIEEDVLKGRRINFIFAIKQRNDGKINSHKWFFQGICKYLQPEQCLMLDIGTKPGKHSIYKLYKYMSKHKHCGGCCGEIEVDFSNDKGISGSYFIKVAQFFEYKMGHFPDKANESFFGFNSVLPGAYSMFRWDAIKGSPLDEFFKNVNRKSDASCAEANEFLAEDRVMCLQIYIKKNEKYYLTFVPEAKAFTDAPESLDVLIKQRRRWMNGSLFGTIKVIKNFTSIVSCKRTKHPLMRQIMMTLFITYYLVSFLFQFFTMGSMYASVTIFLKQQFRILLIYLFEDQNNVWQQIIIKGYIDSFFDYAYTALVIMAIIFSLTMPIERGIGYFRFLMFIFGAIFICTFLGILFYLIKTGIYPEVLEWDGHKWIPTNVHKFSPLVFAGMIMSLIYLMPMILRPIDFFNNFMKYTLGLFAYLFMLPTFSIIMQIYAFCNLHDISWGNRPSQSQGIQAVAMVKQTQEKLKQDYQVFRAQFLYIWILLNSLFGIIISSLVDSIQSGKQNQDIDFVAGFAIFLASLVLFKFTFALIYQIKWNIRFVYKKKDYEKHSVDVTQYFHQNQNDYANISSDEDEEAELKYNGDLTMNSEDDDKEFENADEEEEDDRNNMLSRRSRILSRMSSRIEESSVINQVDQQQIRQSSFKKKERNNEVNQQQLKKNLDDFTFQKLQSEESQESKKINNDNKKIRFDVNQAFQETVKEKEDVISNNKPKKKVGFSLGEAFSQSNFTSKK